MTKLATLHVDLEAARAAGCAGSLLAGTEIQRFLEEPHAIDPALRRVLEAGGACTVVYYACGTCANGGARVEYFCSAGGSAPDHVGCEAC
ncbi:MULTISPECIES: hypothetical protein [unclassified Novosphingobium]|uniref:hypothetical protein n=1 Tax=unclassified Novosphingobium TaxID=2644732 RepID=UPI000A43909E|nr:MULTISPECIES: hypothetical protein [unclassified Novosphingobium]MPS71383.1 hypothetical protein [Novosphingobium sp.]TCM28134.1 hypothetical protein EDF59_13043 [Novosphingobium sp. ST904]